MRGTRASHPRASGRTPESLGWGTLGRAVAAVADVFGMP